MLRIGDKDGIYPAAVQFALPAGGPPFGEVGRLADAGAELDRPSEWWKLDPMESRCELLRSVDEGVHSSCEVPDSRRDEAVVAIGLNKSRVRSNISEPMAPMAVAYRSLRIRDSLTIKSANMRTLSASVAASASLDAKDLKRSTVALANCSAVCAAVTSFGAEVGGREDSRNREPDDDLV